MNQTLTAIVMIVAGTVVTYLTWDSAINERSFFLMGAAGPMFILMGIGLLAPGLREELRSDDGNIGWNSMSIRSKVFVVVCLGVALVNWYLLEQAINAP